MAAPKRKTALGDWLSEPVDTGVFPAEPKPKPEAPFPEDLPPLGVPGGSAGNYDDDPPEPSDPNMSPAALRERLQNPVGAALASPSGPSHASRERTPLEVPRVGDGSKHGASPPASAYAENPDPPKEKKEGESGKPGALAPRVGEKGNEKKPPDEREEFLNQVEAEARAKARGGGGARRKPGLELSGKTQEVRPGENVIPEIRWALGLDKRPDMGEELDPDVALDVSDPTYRKVKTETERFGDKAADRARLAAQQEHAAQQEAINNHMRGLTEEADALDANLAETGNRRKRLETMREAAVKAGDDARNTEPRTHQQVWQSKGGLGRMMGTIAMAIGGYTQGLGRNGGRNPGADMVNKVIDDAVDEEREKAERADKKAGQMQSDYERAFALYGDPEVAMLQSKLRKINNVQAMLDQRAKLKGLDEGAQERTAELQEAARMKAYEYVDAIEKRFNGAVLSEKLTYSQPKPTGGGGPVTSAQVMAAKAKARADWNKAHGIKEEGGPVDAPTADINKRQAAMVPLKKMLQGYKDDDEIPGIKDFNIVSRGGRWVVDTIGGAGAASRTFDKPEEIKNRQIVQGVVSSKINELSGSGVSNDEREDLRQQFLQARTKADLVNVLDNTEAVLAEQRRLNAGGTPDAPTERSSGERDE